jgi:hypothetical protein
MPRAPIDRCANCGDGDTRLHDIAVEPGSDPYLEGLCGDCVQVIICDDCVQTFFDRIPECEDFCGLPLEHAGFC